MSGALQLLEQLSEAGVRLEADADRIRFAPKSAVSDVMIAGLRRHKDEIIALLTAGGSPGRATSGGRMLRDDMSEAHDCDDIRHVDVDGNALKPEANDNTVDATASNLNQSDEAWHRLASFRPRPSGLWDDYRYLNAADLEYLMARPDGANRCAWCGRWSGHVLPTTDHPGCVGLSDEWAVKLPCGQFKGRPVRDVDRGYLQWLRSNMASLPVEVKTEIDAELDRRRLRSGTP